MTHLFGSSELWRVWSALLAILVLGIAALGCGSPTPEITVVMTEFSFEPNKVNVTRGTKTLVRLENQGQVEHNFSIPQLNITSLTIQPGKAGTVEVTSPRGPLKIVCTVPGHEEAGHVAELVVAARR